MINIYKLNYTLLGFGFDNTNVLYNHDNAFTNAIGYYSNKKIANREMKKIIDFYRNRMIKYFKRHKIDYKRGMRDTYFAINYEWTDKYNFKQHIYFGVYVTPININKSVEVEKVLTENHKKYL